MRSFRLRFICTLALVTSGLAMPALSRVPNMPSAQPTLVQQEVSDSQLPPVCDALMQALAKNLSPEQLLNVSQDLNSLAKRLAARGNSAELQDIARDVLATVSAETAKLSRAQRLILAQQIISQCATPTSINQGHHNTCAVTALEERMSTLYPATVTKIVCELAIRGGFNTAYGDNVSLDQNSLVPDAEAQNFPVKYAQRSFASQLFQLAAINAYWSRATKDPRGIAVPKGSMKYIQRIADAEDRKDTGERLVINWPNGIVETVVQENGMISFHPSFGMAQLSELSYVLTGVHEEAFLIGNVQPWGKQPVAKIKSEKDLHKTLSALAHHGRLPAIVAVNLHGGLLGSNTAGGGFATDWHAVNVVAYDEQSGKVELDNWWGEFADLRGSKAVSLHALYEATCPTATASRSVAVNQY